VDSRLAGKDAGQELAGKANGIPIQHDVLRAFKACQETGTPATHLVIGLAPDGGRLPPQARRDVVTAIQLGLHVDSGLHDFLSEDEEIAQLAASKGVRIRDIRRTPPRSDLHFFSGKIEQVDCLKVAVLGTDSAVGKRTTAWLLVDGFAAVGFQAELVGTGQTAWMQGARYSVMMDSLINDFVAGEIEHAVWSAWHEQRPDVVIIEGQGSLMNPAYPGGFEIMAAGRPDVVVLQHAPARKEYDGFPGYPIHPLEQQIQAIELVSGKPVVAITISHEGLASAAVPETCRSIRTATGLPTYDVLLEGGRELCALLSKRMPARQAEGGTQIPRGTRTRAARKGRTHADAR
jgi:uncharacterized NAD-dependent epimerase/dehydratase family protein